jgi:hypothetical protein
MSIYLPFQLSLEAYYLIWFSNIFMQLPKEAVPDPDNLELWLKVQNIYT